MNYHNILHDDMRNGDGLRVVLFVSGCDHKCYECQNPQTWDVKSGIPFDKNAEAELLEQLSYDYISGITFSGGDPLNEVNVDTVYKICIKIRDIHPNKSIWIYTGYTIEEIFSDDNSNMNAIRQKIVLLADVLVDGKFKKELADVTYKWAGSSNQRVIDIKRTILEKNLILWD